VEVIAFASNRREDKGFCGIMSKYRQLEVRKGQNMCMIGMIAGRVMHYGVLCENLLPVCVTGCNLLSLR